MVALQPGTVVWIPRGFAVLPLALGADNNEEADGEQDQEPEKKKQNKADEKKVKEGDDDELVGTVWSWTPFSKKAVASLTEGAWTAIASFNMEHLCRHSKQRLWEAKFQIVEQFVAELKGST